MKFFTAALVSIVVALPFENARDGAAQGAAAGAAMTAAVGLPALALMSVLPGLPAGGRAALLKQAIPMVGANVLGGSALGAVGGAAAGSVAARRHNNDVSTSSA